MPSIAVQAAKSAITAASAVGRLTITSNVYFFPGANAWVTKNDGSATARVKILACIGTDTLLVRKWPLKMEADGTTHGQENYGPPGYGVSDMSAFNATSHICMESQSVPVDPTYAKRVVP